MCLPVHSNDVPRFGVVAVVAAVAVVVALEEEDQVSFQGKRIKPVYLLCHARATATRKNETGLEQIT